MPISKDTLQEITAAVRGGFDERDRIIEIFREEKYEPGELDAAEVEAAVDAAFSELVAEQASWATVTDCDKLDEVFETLNRRHIISIQNAGYTQSDGYDDVRELYHRAEDKQSILGYCFYHGQDLERVVATGQLNLAFGPMDAKEEQTNGAEVGTIIVEELRQSGFTVQWNGKFDQRICISGIDWKRSTNRKRRRDQKRGT